MIHKVFHRARSSERYLAAAALACALLAWSGGAATAGIIVTEGDIAQSGGRIFTLHSDIAPPAAPDASSTAVPGGALGQIARGAGPASKQEARPPSAHGSKLPGGTASAPPPEPARAPGSDLDQAPPAGWACTDLPGGMQYCEPAAGATGAAAGAAGGGTASLEDAVSMAADEGCGGAGGPEGLLAALVGLALLAATRLRARVRVLAR
ncbi:MAG: hypothetical protein H6744_06530 [Deltaproteobacteria bacterium]|nr:hypothetical protein [Deltaproteobacteria bacterium]MCB9786337.1 hypothetical protein [Deltaproteobacteria bacterium]